MHTHHAVCHFINFQVLLAWGVVYTGISNFHRMPSFKVLYCIFNLYKVLLVDLIGMSICLEAVRSTYRLTHLVHQKPCTSPAVNVNVCVILIPGGSPSFWNPASVKFYFVTLYIILCYRKSCTDADCAISYAAWDLLLSICTFLCQPSPHW